MKTRIGSLSFLTLKLLQPFIFYVFLFLEYYLRLSDDLTLSLCRRVFCSFQKQDCTYINKPIANAVIRRCSVK